MSTDSDGERTFSIAVRAMELMRTYGSSADPRAYEVWYTYAQGHKPLMNDAIKRLVASHGALPQAELEALHKHFLSSQRFAVEAEKTSTGVIAEIDQVVEMIDFALGSAARYGQSLEAFSAEVSGPLDRRQIRHVLESMVVATKEVSSTNRVLEARLKETRGEIETLRSTLEEVRVESLTDPLTGIANRKHFESMLIRAIDEANEERSPLALIVIDIDHFKRFNDTYGHLTGDQVLRLVSMTMREQVKTKATLARFGGEEFGIILPQTTIETAEKTAERVRESVMARELVKRSTGESLGKVTISVGVAALRRNDTAVSILERADQCMYAAKRNGRNQTVIDSEPEGEALPDVA